MPDDPKPDELGEPKGEMGGYNRRKRRGDLKPPEPTLEEIQEWRKSPFGNGGAKPPKEDGEQHE